eukprot:TRINITY_DN22831_c0_g1_i1.p1 TRINITY_DN22831_c0_g1~~TRINITY_DN22831_c0_g1_i1.p1  ORF type:complete len:278 (-),score=28.65 TRINITY_DN22831_c0_g1_i1:441-1274(-)
MGPPSSIDAASYFVASGTSALLCFPLWKAAAVSQSGFVMKSTSPAWRYWEAAKPPWRGGLNVVLGMTWARAAIFYGSDRGKRSLQNLGYGVILSVSLPPMLISASVQVCNQPFTRASVMLQDPQCELSLRRSWFPTVAVMRQLLETKGLGSWFVGTSAAVMKVVPKYLTAVVVKDFMDKRLQQPESRATGAHLIRSVKKSATAGIAGALLTNPFDVLRNEMFKTEQGIGTTCRRLFRTEGARWLYRGWDKNMMSVAVPIACTILLADIFADEEAKPR